MIYTLMSWMLAAAVAGAPTTVTVQAVLLVAPSEIIDVDSLDELGPQITGFRQLVPDTSVYLEVWFKTSGPYGIVVAVLDVRYDPDVLGTTLQQVVVASPWRDGGNDVFVTSRTVDDAAGLITDIGGLTFLATGLFQWAKLATIEFDVKETAATETTICTVDGGPARGFGMVSIGAVPDEEVAYGCISLVDSGYGCQDRNRDGAVDLRDFAMFQNEFGPVFGR